MSAPLVVNTKDGACWTRREETRGGEALYAPEKCGACPAFVMVTLTELAELGIAGSADVMPMPVGPQPQTDADRAKAPWGRHEDGRPILGPGAHWTDVPELVDQEVARIRGRVDQAQSGHWYVASDTEAWRPAGTVRTNVDGYQRTVGQCTNMRAADLDLVLHAHDDLSWCLEMVAKFRARVSELEADLATANGVLDDTAKARRAASIQALPWAHEMPDGDLHGFLDDMVSAALGRWRSGPEVPDRTVLADIERVCVNWRTPGEGFRSDAEPGPVAALRKERGTGETDPGRRAAWRMLKREERHDSPLHHDWQLGRDLPGTGGAE